MPAAESTLKTQVSTTLVRRSSALRFGAAFLLVLVPMLPVSARARHNDAWARERFADAERMREALNGRPADERTRRQYQRVINAYRTIYFGAPASAKADPSVVASAELMVEMGRQFEDNKILRQAVEQYRFLRKEYPGSKYRFDALFTIGEVYKDDLNDPEEARATFAEFLHRYPRHHLADDSRAALEELDANADEMEQGRAATNTAVKGHGDEPSPDSTPSRRSKLPRVTGIRHWSTPDYTRVAIDIEKEVKFDSQRIGDPDRVFFDLRDTRLASILVGKTFDVDDGFLRKIRVGEYQPGRTRVVLEVDDLASYEAFLLPNPYRIIIDVHGRQSRAALMARRTGVVTEEAGDSDGKADWAPSIGDEEARSRSFIARGTKSETATIRFSKAKPPENEAEKTHPDAPPTASGGAEPVPAIGVVKTTTTVPGSNRKIPKTIVEAEDEAPTTVATLQSEPLRPEVTPAQRAKISETDPYQ